MSDILKPIKGQLRQAKKHPLIATVTIVVFLALIGGLTALVVTSGGGGNGATTTPKASKPSRKHDKGLAAARKRKVKRAPVVNGAGTLDVARSVGRLAIAQGRGTIKHPTGIEVRVSAAPKQTVTVNYQISCFRAVGKSASTKISNGEYRTKPPNLRSIPIPLPGADQCIATVDAQLTKNAGKGRVKVAVIAG